MLWDDSQGNTMDTKGLAEALYWMTQNNTLFDVLFLDACLMGMVEVLAELQAYAHYTIAAENLIWAIYPYHRYLKQVNSQTTPLALAQHMAQVNYEVGPSRGHPLQIGVIDNSQVESMTHRLNDLALSLRAILATSRETIQQAVLETARLDSNQNFLIRQTDAHVDLRGWPKICLIIPR